MKVEELYHGLTEEFYQKIAKDTGLTAEKQKQYEQETIDRYGDPARKHIEESHRRVLAMSPQQWDCLKERMHNVYMRVAVCIGLYEPDHHEVQELMCLYYQNMCAFFTPNRQAFEGIGILYAEHPGFRKLYEQYHPQLADYLRDAMCVFAHTQLV